MSIHDTAAAPSPELELSDEEAALLASLLGEDAGDSLQEPSILRQADADRQALSFAQERLWLLNQLDPDSVAYNMTFAIRLRGRLDVGALERSLEAIVARHEALRTVFLARDGAPVAQVVSQVSLPLVCVDLTALPPAECEAAARRLAADDARVPFDLTTAPLLRTRLLRFTQTEHVLVLTFHHIVCDGWSLDLFFAELAAEYEAALAGRPLTLTPLPIQYQDFAAWQRQWLAGPVRDQQLAYWTRQLADAPAVLDLPTDHPRPARQTFRGAVHTFALPAALRHRLDGLARQEGATLYMALLAGFAAVLARYARQDDLVVGSPIANRTRPETESLIGFFVNTLALRIDLTGQPSFRELLARVRETTLGAFAHQDLPFEQIVEALQPERDLSRHPIFQTMFVFQAASREPLGLGDLELSELEIEGETAKFDLTLTVADAENGPLAFFEYSTDLFDAATIGRLAGHLLRLLEGAVADPDRRVSTLPILAAAERHDLLTQHGDLQAFPVEDCLHAMFARQAAQDPEAVAVTCDASQLTYRQLDRRANQLAHHLRRLGVGPDVLVALYAERSLDLVVAILGIVKAGGAYLPLDPSYPADRLAFMLDDARAPVLLTQQALRDQLPETAATVLCLDADWPAIAVEPDDAPTTGVTPEHLAYVIYTSGSTGRPKGVQITHQNVVRLFTATEHWYGFGPDDVWTLFHSYAFDFSVWEIWGALLYGGRLVVAPFWVSRSPDTFHALLAAEGVTILNQTPSAFRQLIAADAAAPSDRELALRYVIFGGEALDTRTLLPWYARHADDRPTLVNMYGITETTVHVTYRALSRADAESPSSPIGAPIPDLRLYLLDGNLEPAPIGVPGELYIGGDGLARGYLNRPELTAERFIRDPFSADPRARLYKSGDVARYLPNGSLEFIGRADNQVKIRGFRIELGEIEAVLSQHPGVQECVVLAREDAPGDRRLVAYVVGRGSAPPAVAKLRDFMKQRLAEYMAPSVIVVLDALPLTVNGKLDRKALPAPSAARSDLEREVTMPRDMLEHQLVQIWQDVLNVQPVGISDNFFDLGGHSLLAVRLVAQVQSRLGQAVPLSALFQGGTIEHLADLLRGRGAGPDASGLPSSLVPIQLAGSRQPFFCVHPSGGNVLCYADLARRLGADQPFYGLQATDDGQDRPYNSSIEAMAAHYLTAVRAVQPLGPYALGGWSFGGLVAFEMARQIRAAGEEVSLLALLDTQPPGAPLDESDTDSASILSWLAGDLAEQAGIPLTLSTERLRQMGPDEQITASTAEMMRAGIDLPGDGIQWVRNFLLGFRARVDAAQRYAPQPYDGRITLFQASDSGGDAPPTGSPWAGWRSLSTQPVVIHAAPGRHAEMVFEPHVGTLAERLRACLDETLAGR